jgi:GT2 family glycosyltransferase
MNRGPVFTASRPNSRPPHTYWVDRLFFDEDAYLGEYPEVARAVEAGGVGSGYDHFQRYGKWEGRPYPLRNRILGPLLMWVLVVLEATVRGVAGRLDPFELGPRLLDGVHRLRHRGGPDSLVGFRAGPWTCTLLPWQRSRRVFLELRVESPARSVPCRVQPLDSEQEPLGDAQALEARPGQTCKRVITLPDGCVALRLSCSQGEVLARPLSVRVKPLSNARARALFRRRIERGGVRLPERVSMKDLWGAYQSTFPTVGSPSYDQWIARQEAPRLALLDSTAESLIAGLPERPLVSVLVPTYDPSEEALRACIDSVLTQSYPDWELVIVDDASRAAHVRQILDGYAASDARVRVHYRSQNGHISVASEDALERAKGQLVGLLDHDDVLCRHALLSMVQAAAAHPEAEVFYSDEDKLASNGVRCQPHFKPAFDPDRLLGQNYIAHFLVARRQAMVAAGGFRKGFEGSQDHDLVLRLTQNLDAKSVVHVPEILYHWRQGAASTAGSVEAKPYALEAGCQAVNDALQAQSYPAVAEIDAVGKCYRVRWELPHPAPRVSIIIPTRDALHLLRQCVSSLLERTNYDDYEVLIVDNQSVEEATLRYFAQVVSDPRVRVIPYAHPFNFSAINNFAVAHASGEILVLLNNDIEVEDGNWLREMVALAARGDTGCVGAKLLYPDGRIQHAGVVLGIGGVAGHAFKYAPRDALGYFSKLRMAHTVSAVTAACLAVRKSVFEQVGGLDERGLTVAFNDVDFCIKVREAGYRNVLTPHAVLVHHESATRGSDDDESRRERFAGEQRVMKERWGAALVQDPYYSPHLTLEREDYGLG